MVNTGQSRVFEDYLTKRIRLEATTEKICFQSPTVSTNFIGFPIVSENANTFPKSRRENLCLLYPEKLLNNLVSRVENKDKYHFLKHFNILSLGWVCSLMKRRWFPAG